MLDICSTSIILTLLQNFKSLSASLIKIHIPQASHWQHIAARLSADENDTLGPVSDALRALALAISHSNTPKRGASARVSISRIPLSLPAPETYANWVEWHFKEGRSLHPNSFMGLYGAWPRPLSGEECQRSI